MRKQKKIFKSENVFYDLLSGLSDILFPPYCFNCSAFLFGEKRKYVCNECINAIGIESPVTIDGERNVPRGFSESYSLGRHEGVLKKAVHSFKYNGKIHLGREIIREFLKVRGNEVQQFRPELVAFVPLHPIREWRRGYNQAFIIAEEISLYLNINIFLELRRLKNTRQQVGLGKREREKNIRGAFGLRKGSGKVIKGKRILIVDDVITTGVTSRECSKLFKNAGAEDTALFTISRRL